MNPESTKAGFINNLVHGAREIPVQIMDQDFCVGRLAKRFMLKMLGKDADFPAFLMSVNSRINALTRKIEFASLFHGKSPFESIYSVAG
jgi:hypothetical protein